ADLRLPNLTAAAPGNDGELLAAMADFDAGVTVDDLACFGAWSGLPVVVKGVLRGDDARACVHAGVRGVAVSNHGGRTGADVVKALALGATAVLVGRPVVWGLAIGGEDGVVDVLEAL